MKIKSQEIKNWMEIILCLLLMIAIIIFVFNYAFTDWEKISAEFSGSFKEISKTISCEVDYKDFHYKGYCINNDDIFSFLNNVSAKE